MKRSEIAGILIAVFIVAMIATFSYMSGMIHKPPAPVRSVNCSDSGAMVKIISQDGRSSDFKVEVATTPEERARGLMNRASLSADRGMLFIFEDSDIRCFWMQDTLIPLDMVFIDQNGKIIDIYENATPLSKSIISSAGPCRYVLEVNGGTCRKMDIDVGDRAIIE